MKRIISLVIAILMLTVMFAACGRKYDTYNYDLTKYIDLSEYKHLPAQAIKPLTDEALQEAVDGQIIASLNYYAKNVDLGDKPIETGDIARVDYVSSMPGQGTLSENTSNVDIIVGYGEYPEELESALVGHQAGDTFYVDITFPDPYEPDPDYSGKTVEVFVLVDAVFEKQAPEYTDDFVRAYLLHDSIEDYENYLRDTYSEQNKKSFFEAVSATTWNQILENTTVIDYPEAELKQYYDLTVASVNNYVTALSLDFASFVKSNFGMTEDEFYEYAMDTAKEAVKEEMIVNLIARKENITISDEDYTEIATEIATGSYGYETLDELENKFTKKEICVAVLKELVQRFVVENADITYVD